MIAPGPIFPPLTGAAVRSAQLLRALATQFEPILVAPQDEAALRTDGWAEALRNVAVRDVRRGAGPRDRRFAMLSRAQGVHRRLRRLARGAIWPGWRFNPLHVHAGPYEGAVDVLESLLTRGDVRAVIVEHVWGIETLAGIRRRWPGIHRVLDAHNVESVNMRRFLDLRRRGGRRISRLEGQARTIRALESRLARYVDAFWACSEDDRRALDQLNRSNGVESVVVANGVDTRHYRWQEARPLSPPTLIYTGTLSYVPSGEAILWFLDHVWPLIRADLPTARLIVAGSNPPNSLRWRASSDASVTLTGAVPDLRAEYARASVAICPVRIGSGTRLKLLEAMSAGVPVVSTTLGAEGLDVDAGVHLMVADTPAPFAAAVARLVRDAKTADRIRRAARHHVENRYDWRLTTRPALDAIRGHGAQDDLSANRATASRQSR